jgi:hypothetical protein
MTTHETETSTRTGTQAPRASRRNGAAPASAPAGGWAAGRLDDLLDLDADTLHDLYLNATVPALEEVRGDLRGRMLAIPSFGRGTVAQLIRQFAGSSYFPWRGKSFSPRSAARGEGINRVISDRFRLYRFETFVGGSRAGDFDAVQLDYDLPENPFFIRVIKDEIRQLGPGLYLGQAWLNVGKAPVLGLYFALERP